MVDGFLPPGGARPAPPRWWHLLLVAAPLLAHALVVVPRFDGLYGQDSFAYFDYAVGPLRLWLLHGGQLPSFHWPPGYPLLVALASLVVGVTPRAAQVASLAAAALIPPVTALIAHELSAERRVCLLAGLFAGLTGQLWQSSVVAMSDTAGLAAAAVGVWALLRWTHDTPAGRPRGPGWLAMAAAGLAYGILSRWASALVALPAGSLAVVIAARRPLRRSLPQLALAGLVGLALLSPLVAPAAATLLGHGGDGSRFTVDLAVSTWNPLNAFRRSFDNADGHQEHPLPNLLFYGLAPARRVMLSPLGGLFLLAGLAAAARRLDAPRLAVLLAWPAVVLGFLAGGTYQNFRFILTALPPFAILAAIGSDRAARLLGERRRWALGAALAATMAWMMAGGATLTSSFVARQAATLDTVRWVEATVEPDARLLSFDVTLAVRHWSRLEVVELYDQDPRRLATLLADGRPTYLLADTARLDSQWRALPPGECFRWLRDRVGLEPVGRHNRLDLMRVVRPRPADGTAAEAVAAAQPRVLSSPPTSSLAAWIPVSMEWSRLL